MRIAGVASAFPSHYYSQQEITAALQARWQDKLANPEVANRLLARVGVGGRYLALPVEGYDGLTAWGKANDAWIKVGEELAEKSLCRALMCAEVSPQELAAIFFVSITGIASPSIDARLLNRMRLSPAIKRVPIFGLGCVAGAAGLARAADYVRAYPDQYAALVAVELCSLTWQRDDLSVANIISSGLFGDGAAAVIVAGEQAARSFRPCNGKAAVAGNPGTAAAGAAKALAGRHGWPRILDSRSSFYPDTEDVMGWKISEKGFSIVLSTSVPRMVYEHLAQDVDAFLAANGLQHGDIGHWIMHTGGPKILEATAEVLHLPAGALDASWECLRKVGNLSSASVLLVLEQFVNQRRPAPGSYGLLAAMGPGFCSELVLLRW
jgi:alkylresorcinol/alkylpyrone synthase